MSWRCFILLDLKESLSVLSEKDPTLGSVIQVIDLVDNNSVDDDFTSLTKIIVSQQLSGAAANTIILRVKKVVNSAVFDPIHFSSIPHQDLRECGISNAKISYIKGLAELLLREPSYFIDLQHCDEKEVLKKLCEIRGVGVWSASIFAIGALGYENIFPFGDTTLNKSIKIIYGNKVTIEEIIFKWTPYKSIASRVLWKWFDQGMPELN